MSISLRCALPLLITLSAAAQPVRAQDSEEPEFLTQSLYRLERIASFSPEFHPGIVLADMFLSGLSTFPVGASSSAFTYSFRPDLGIQSRDTRTFGPIYVERPYTVGKARLSFGTNVGHVSFSSFEGHRLDDGILVQQFFYQGRTRPGDEIRTTLKLSRTSVAFFTNFGVTDWLEVGAILPMVRVGWSGELTYRDAPTQRVTFTDTDQVSTAGIGDIAVRAKVKAFGGSRAAVGGIVEYRIPTGDAAKMLGALGPSVKVSALSTARFGRIAPHFNIGYTAGWGLQYIFSGLNEASRPDPDSDIRLGAPDEIEIAGGAEFEVSPVMSLVGDVIFKDIRDVGTLGTRETIFRYSDSRGEVPVSALIRERGHSRTSLGTIGFKWAMNGGLVASVSGLFALSDGGLKPRPGLLTGLDYSF